MNDRQRWRKAVGAKVQAAVKSGRLVKQPCEVCGELPAWTGEPSKPGAYATVVAHHDDYSKPLDVRWLCRWHHAEHHRLQGAYRRKAAS